MCTAGADGNAIIWKSTTPSTEKGTKLKFNKECVLSHAPSSGDVGADGQIYSCEPIFQDGSNNSPKVLTAADNEMFLWDLDNPTTPQVSKTH